MACKLGNEEITKLIIYKTKINKLDDKIFNLSPIYIVCSLRKEKFQTFRILFNILKENKLLNSIFDRFDDENKTLLEISIERNHLKIIDLILSEYKELKKAEKYDSNGNLIIHIASKYGTKELFEILLKNDLISFKSTLNSNENALHISANYNKFEFIKSLLKYEKETFQSDELGAKHLIKYKNKQNYTPLQIAIIKRYEKCTKELIVSDFVELDVRDNNDNNNYSIYHLCVLHFDLESLNILLNKNDTKFYDPLFYKTRNNETPIHLACKIGQIESIKLIMNKLNDKSTQTIEPYLKTQNKDGRTCFHIACIYGQYNIMEYYLKDLKITYFIEMIDNDLNTCLLLAAQNGHERIVELNIVSVIQI